MLAVLRRQQESSRQAIRDRYRRQGTVSPPARRASSGHASRHCSSAGQGPGGARPGSLGLRRQAGEDVDRLNVTSPALSSSSSAGIAGPVWPMSRIVHFVVQLEEPRDRHDGEREAVGIGHHDGILRVGREWVRQVRADVRRCVKRSRDGDEVWQAADRLSCIEIADELLAGMARSRRRLQRRRASTRRTVWPSPHRR